MSCKRRNQKQKHKATQENTTNDSLATKRENFLWNNEHKITLLHCMIKQKPADNKNTTTQKKFFSMCCGILIILL